MTLHTGTAALKSHAVQGPPIAEIGPALDMMIEDKGYDRTAVASLGRARLFGPLLNETLLRSGAIASREDQNGVLSVINYSAALAQTGGRKNPLLERYRGKPRQNRAIDRVLTAPRQNSRVGVFVGEGATSQAIVPNAQYVRTLGVETTPIAVVGYGAAGVMVSYALDRMGFSNVVAFDPKPTAGIWYQPNVHQGTRNNPRSVAFGGNFELSAAPGRGDEVLRFINNIADNRRQSAFKKRAVKNIEPGHLSHSLVFSTGETETYPIVINAMGHGLPVPLSDPARMMGPAGKIAASRWQQPNLTRSDVEGKRFIFVGLGNSTAEMLRVLHRFEDQGIQVDYRVLTHYPRDAVWNPSDTVYARGKNFRVFRDLNKPDLTSFQGDLEDSRLDYYRALNRGRILTDVSGWDLKRDVLAARQGKRGIEEISHDQLYVLTGYRNSAETVEKLGCFFDDEDQCVVHDYDGELAADPGVLGVDRVHAGYFGLGSVLDAPHNRNATVIPGIAFRLPDLLFGVLMRAAEYKNGLAT